MKALYIVLPILLFVALLLFSRVRIIFAYNGGIQLRISYLFVRIRLYPRNKRKPKKGKAKAEKKKTAMPADAPPPMAKKHTEKPKAKKKPPLKLGDIRFLLRLCRDVIAHILDRASHHVRISVKHLSLSIGGANDAARAAIEYGIVSQSAAYLLEFLRNTGFLKKPKRGAINIGVNFLGEENDLAVRTDITCRLIFLIPFALSALTKALTAKSRWTRHRARAAQDKNQKTKENDNG